MQRDPSHLHRRVGRRVLLAAISAAILTAVVMTATATARSTAAAPANVTLPSLSGSPTRGSTLTASPGTWTGDAPIAFSYIWERCNSGGGSCAAISGATSNAYTIVSASVGSTVRVHVSASNVSGITTANSAVTATITVATGPANTSAPAISGTAAQGQTLTLSQGTWTGLSPMTFSYQWKRCDSRGNNCTDASTVVTTNTIVLAAADVDKTIRGFVVATDANGTSTAFSSHTARITPTAVGPGNSSVPTLSGTATVGQTLSLFTGSWSGPSPITFLYQWKRCDAAGNACTDASGIIATNTVSLTLADVGKTLRGVVYAKNPSGATTSATSAPSGVVAAVSGPVGAITLANGRISVPAASVSLPVRLIISNVQFTPVRLVGRAAFTLKVWVTDSQSHAVRDALVLATTIPYGWAGQPAETRTGADGTVVFNLTPTANMPLRNAALLTFLRARKDGDDMLGGISTRRLIQVSIG